MLKLPISSSSQSSLAQNPDFWRELLWTFCPFALFVSLLLFVWHSLEIRREIQFIKSKEDAHVELGVETLRGEVSTVTSDLLFLAEANSLQRLIATQSKRDQQVLEQEYLALSRHKGFYDQIRWLNWQGQEVVRVNSNNGNPVVVPEDLLQDKSHRYYFQDTWRLNAGEIFVSPLDLNIEGQKIERPLKPMMRFSTPVYGVEGEKAGIILLNYLADTMLQRLEQVLASIVSQPMLLNADGYWLMAPDPADEWGFMLGNHQRTFQQDYPQAWQTLSQQQQGQFTTEAGIFTFTTVYPLTTELFSSTGASAPDAPSQQLNHQRAYAWKVVTLVPAAALAQIRNYHLFQGLMQGSVLLLGLLLISALVAWAKHEQQKAILALRANEQRLRTITSTLGEGIIVLDQQSHLALMNPEAERLLGWQEADLLGRDLHAIIHTNPDGQPIPEICCGVITALRQGQTVRVSEDEFTQADGTRIIVAYTATPLWEGSHIVGVVVAFHNVTQEVMVKQRLSQMAARDALTGLVNRRELEQAAQQTILRASQMKTSFAFIILDVDHFKQVNDTYGHLVGDAVLRQLSHLLEQELRTADIIARYGGEEFVMVLPDIQELATAKTAERLRQTIADTPFELPAEPDSRDSSPSDVMPCPPSLRITVSLGIAMYLIYGDSLELLLNAADQALYTAKHEGRNQVRLAHF